MIDPGSANAPLEDVCCTTLCCGISRERAFPRAFAGLVDSGYWRQSPITWSLENHPERMSLTHHHYRATRDAIALAFDTWAAHIGARFSYAGRDGGIIHIRFRDLPDAPLGVLAIGHFPPPVNPEPLAGNIDFRDSLEWGIHGEPDRYDITTVCLHEIGHAIGLKHSDKPNDIMFPAYPGIRQHLGHMDAHRAQELYGRPEKQKTSRRSWLTRTLRRVFDMGI